MNLKLLPAPRKEDPIPRLPLRRAGERREPLPTLHLNQDFVRACEERSLHPLVAAEIALEAAVARLELRALEREEMWPCLVSAAMAVALTAIAAPQRSYFRSLTMRRRTSGVSEAVDELIVDVPVRLFPRVVSALEESLQPQSIDDAIALEIAAVASGRTLIEWVLVCALDLSR